MSKHSKSAPKAPKPDPDVPPGAPDTVDAPKGVTVLDPHAAPVAPETTTDPKPEPEKPKTLADKFREEFYGNKGENGWKPLIWLKPDVGTEAVITSTNGVLADGKGTVLVFPKQEAELLANELSKARPGDQIRATPK